MVVSMQSRAGFMKMGGAVGVMMFLQFWYWYPLKHFLSLSFAPTMIIGLNKDFDMPNSFAVTCLAPPSMFAYPKAEEKKEDEKKLVATAVLSTTARAKAREARKEARKLTAPGGLGSPTKDSPSKDHPGEGPALERSSSLMSTNSYMSLEEQGGKDKEDAETKPKKDKEPSSFPVCNPARLTVAQSRFIAMQPSAVQRYRPVTVNANVASGSFNDPTSNPSPTFIESRS